MMGLMKMNKGRLIVVTGPSGSGKGTVLQKLFSMRSDVAFSVSATTRNPRMGEIDGVHYHFISEKTFLQMAQNSEMLEHAQYCGNYYGTPANYVRQKLEQGINVILEIEVQGALKIKQQNIEAEFVFIIPPSMEELEKRLKNRGTEDEATIQKRLNRAKKEYEYMDDYDYIVINRDVETAALAISAIIDASQYKKNYVLQQLKGVE
jgi:guanylate kinase